MRPLIISRNHLVQELNIDTAPIIRSSKGKPQKHSLKGIGIYLVVSCGMQPSKQILTRFPWNISILIDTHCQSLEDVKDNRKQILREASEFTWRFLVVCSHGNKFWPVPMKKFHSNWHCIIIGSSKGKPKTKSPRGIGIYLAVSCGM